MPGTANERSIGTACSMGCVRMLNRGIIHLIDLVAPGTPVVMLDNKAHGTLGRLA
jgi:lipoprotein-anchoring transpeptidase ErfK/SrfK